MQNRGGTLAEVNKQSREPVPNRKSEAHEVSAASIPTAPGAAKRIAAGQR